MMRLVQIKRQGERRVALVEEPHVRLIPDVASVHDLANAALESGVALPTLVAEWATGKRLDYDAIHRGTAEWRLLPPVDHPHEPARCLVSGTGLTHMGSAQDRHAMHEMKESELTDSMKMFRWGLERGRPASGEIGIAPEWFYKGNGAMLRAHGEPLLIPIYALDGGEEAEIAGIYLIDPEGQPRRIGMAVGNEFSDHRFEKLNYLNLAGSKIRTCALGPELVLDPEFRSVPGKVTIRRDGRELWTREIRTGEAEMCHSLQNIEHHHFKFEAHRRPGDVHVHYFGAGGLSFGAGVELIDGDLMEIEFQEFGRALHNPVSVAAHPQPLIQVTSL